MIHWKVSVLSVALGAAATVGFVWLGRRPRKLLQSSAAPALDSDVESEFNADEAARADALHDLELADREAMADVAESMDAGSLDVEPIDVELGDAEIEVNPFDEEPLSDGERYDAVDPERLGNEFLNRALDAPHVSPPAPEPFAPLPEEQAAHVDTAVEVPVGKIDSNGNVEFHEPHRAPTQNQVELLPTEDELERRRAAEAITRGSDEQNE